MTEGVYLGVETYVSPTTGAITTNLFAFPARNGDDWAAATKWAAAGAGRSICTRTVNPPEVTTDRSRLLAETRGGGA